MNVDSDILLYENKWVSLREVQYNGHVYVYSHEQRCDGLIVSILPFRRSADGTLEFLMHNELTPSWRSNKSTLDYHLNTITGGVDQEGDNINTRLDAIRELREESGYCIDEWLEKAEFMYLGHVRGNKSSDNYYYLYAVDLTGLEPGSTDSDGSYLESLETCQWVDENAVIYSEDPLASVIYVRLMKRLERE